MSVPNSGKVEVAHGRVFVGAPIVATMTLIGALALAVIGLVSEKAISVFVVLLGAVCGLLGASVVVTLWAIRAGGVRYEVEGSRVLVSRGRRLLKDVDTVGFDSVTVVGSLTLRTILTGSNCAWDLSGLPQVVCRRRINRWDDEIVELPHLLLWGREAVRGFQERLDAALHKG